MLQYISQSVNRILLRYPFPLPPVLGHSLFNFQPKWFLFPLVTICSVDYVIHLANAYRESKELTRFNRTRDALVVMGISVISACVTTFLAGFVLFFTYILFFFKFGVFIALTILFSSLWAFGFFMALASAAGK